MPKYRKFYTKAVESLDINDMPNDFTRLMWIMLPLALCREGRGLDHPGWLKSKVFPLRLDVTEQMITDAMDWYASRGMLRRYEVEGRFYFCLVNWHKYQGTTTKEAESIYPPPSDSLQTNSGVAQEESQTNSVTDSIFNIQYSDTPAQTSAGPEPETNPPDLAIIDHYQDTFALLPGKREVDRLLALEREVGREKVVSAINWAYGKNIKQVSAIVTAARKWHSDTGPPGGNGTGPPKPAEPVTITVDDLNRTPEWISG